MSDGTGTEVTTWSILPPLSAMSRSRFLSPAVLSRAAGRRPPSALIDAHFNSQFPFSGTRPGGMKEWGAPPPPRRRSAPPRGGPPMPPVRPRRGSIASSPCPSYGRGTPAAYAVVRPRPTAPVSAPKRKADTPPSRTVAALRPYSGGRVGAANGNVHQYAYDVLDRGTEKGTGTMP